ncbi:ATP-binding protein, partial [Acinetobacter baumannii]
CWVQADSTRLRQVLHNLLGNALKFTEAGEIALRVSRNAAGLFEFAVADTGHGIASEDLPHVFDAFWQAASAKTRRTSGTGLGL